MLPHVKGPAAGACPQNQSTRRIRNAGARFQNGGTGCRHVAHPVARACPQYKHAPGIRNAGKRNGGMWQLRPEIGVVTWRMVHTGRPIRMRHVAPVKAILTAVLRWHKENISCLNIYFNIFSKKRVVHFLLNLRGLIS